MLSNATQASVAGLLGGIVLFSQISQGWTINWKTVLGGFLGFGLGNLIANVVAASLEESTLFSALQMLIWGLIGGVLLAVPSKNYKHYLVLGCLGGIGMVLSELAWIALGEPKGIPILGLVLGLFLGFGTKSASAALILSLVATVGFALRGTLTSYYYASNLSMAEPVKYIFLALTAGLAGAMIGAAWSFLSRAESTASAQEAAK
jgi:hypothetical protein